MSFHLYPKLRQVALLGLIALLENFGYRQLNTTWRFIGLVRWAVRHKARWGTMKRKAHWKGQ
jgi:hypothetical protein